MQHFYTAYSFDFFIIIYANVATNVNKTAAAATTVQFLQSKTIFCYRTFNIIWWGIRKFISGSKTQEPGTRFELFIKWFMTEGCSYSHLWGDIKTNKLRMFDDGLFGDKSKHTKLLATGEENVRYKKDEVFV